MAAMPSSELEGFHAFITGAAGVVGSFIIQEFLALGCYVTSHDSKPYELPPQIGLDRLNSYYGEVTERSLNRSMQEARNKFGPINILILTASYDDKINEYRVWDLPLDTWEEAYQGAARKTFVTIKQFLRSAKSSQDAQSGREIDNLSIVVIGNSKPGEHAVPFDLIQRVKNELPQLNRKARINAVVPVGPINPLMAEDYIAPHLEALARATAFVASDREAGHLSGECIIANNETEGRLAWRGKETISFSKSSTSRSLTIQAVPRLLLPSSGNKIRVAVTIDLDAVSGWLGTGYSPENVLADYSAGFFAARVGVPRLVKMLQRVDIADKVTWFIPGHSAESFTEEVQQVVDTGCEIALHGYAHEGAYSLTVQQERDILEKCIQITKKLTGKRPVGYRAPLYQVRESTLDLLEEYGFEYDSSLTDHDCRPFFAPRRPPLQPIDYSKPASSWMHPIPTSSLGDRRSSDRRPLVEIPCNYYMEDMTPMQFLPHVHNSHGYVDVRSIEQMWKDRFLWIREHEESPIFTIIMHPDTSGMAHVIGMVERMIRWLQSYGDEVEFMQAGEMARWWLAENEKNR
ncbi:polysaccharide deacetylase family protein [Talaromyces stipitatus ATCC 10500]|uniref:Polysaccharide deacetylase family protein n=1 Tax=Talaromyces stipitatus (strain ATCC 10500 / CBS 375.48 / QM 6759 / NRRL 1006) TaxID=441959 RepID=B8M2R3_TALSN|nr:polysaccharide deacetylase family protein [Talaromyces stipitatus ATCC 10500]EED22168.1 polysaccharide deacetylase family protein [Talaromyces stipitatus ATCC 10500]